MVPVHSSPLDVPGYLCRYFTAYILEYTDKRVHALGHIVLVAEEPSGNSSPLWCLNPSLFFIKTNTDRTIEWQNLLAVV